MCVRKYVCLFVLCLYVWLFWHKRALDRVVNVLRIRQACLLSEDLSVSHTARVATHRFRVAVGHNLLLKQGRNFISEGQRSTRIFRSARLICYKSGSLVHGKGAILLRRNIWTAFLSFLQRLMGNRKWWGGRRNVCPNKAAFFKCQKACT